MHRYQNCICDLCHQPLTAEDEVVVCPECGAPMHRSCYARSGSCAHASEHAGGYEWSYPAQGAGAKAACAHCGAQNDPAARFCQLCGAPMPSAAEQPEPGADAGGEWRRAYRYGQYRTEEFDVNGVSSEEMRVYLGKSAEPLLFKFRILLQEHFSPATWNVPALVFGPFYFFYRRMKKTGLILLLLLLAVYIPGYLYTSEYFKAFLAPEMFGVTFPYNETILRIFEPIASVASWGRLILHLYCGVRANHHLLIHAIEEIRSLQAQFPESDRAGTEYRRALALRGAPSLVSALLVFFGFFGLIYAFTALRLAPLFTDAGLM